MTRKFANRMVLVGIVWSFVGVSGCVGEDDVETVDIPSEEIADDSFCDELEEEEKTECQRLWREGLDLLSDESEVQLLAQCDDGWKCCWSAQLNCTDNATAQQVCQNQGQTDKCNATNCRTVCNPSAGNCKCASGDE